MTSPSTAEYGAALRLIARFHLECVRTGLQESAEPGDEPWTAADVAQYARDHMDGLVEDLQDAIDQEAGE
jgi:hypothetical protein